MVLQLNEVQEFVESRTNEFEDKWDEKLQRLDGELRNFSDEIHTLAKRFDTIYHDREMNLLRQISNLNKDMEVLMETRKNDQTEISKLRQFFEDLKQKSFESIVELQNKATDQAGTDTKLKELKEEMKTIVKNLDELKRCAPSNLLESKTNEDRYKSTMSTPKNEDSSTKTYTQTQSQSTSSGYVYKPIENVFSTILKL